MFTLTTALELGLLGFAVGVFGTLVGAGGGFILTPILLVLYPTTTPELITAISLVVVFFNASSGTAAYARQRRVDYRSGLVLAACTVPGSIAGVALAGRMSRPTFDVLMGIALATLAGCLLVHRADAPANAGGVASARVIIDRTGMTYRYRARVRAGAALSVAVGLVSSLLGIGGGVVHVPLLVGVLGFPTHVATATSHFVLAIMALVATVTHVLAGTFHDGVGLRRAGALSIGVVLGAQVGAWLSMHLSGHHIERLLAAGLLLLALRLGVGAAL